jgi:hypothetical protein
LFDYIRIEGSGDLFRKLAAGSPDKAPARGEFKRPAGKGRKERRKRIVFDTREATILLKTKDLVFEKG